MSERVRDGMVRYRATFRQRPGLPDIVAQFAIAPEVVRRNEYEAVRAMVERQAPRLALDNPKRVPVSRVEALVGDQWVSRVWPVPRRRDSWRTSIIRPAAPPASLPQVEVWPHE